MKLVLRIPLQIKHLNSCHETIPWSMLMAVLFMDHLQITKIGCLATSKGHHPIKDRRGIAIIQRDITHRTEVIGRINRVNLRILKASLML